MHKCVKLLGFILVSAVALAFSANAKEKKSAPEVKEITVTKHVDTASPKTSSTGKVKHSTIHLTVRKAGKDQQ